MTFGSYLKKLRQDQQLTAAQLAGMAQVAVRTIYYWESDTRSPWNYEINSVLDALEATPCQRELLFRMLQTPRGIRLARAETRTAESSPQSYVQIPEFGDVISALRKRHGWSQDRLAAALGCQRSTIRRWEASEMFPNEENWERICDALGANARERAARHVLKEVTGHWEDSLDEIERQVDLWIHGLDNPAEEGDPLAELSAIILERRLGLAVLRSDSVLPLLLRFRARLAEALLFWGNKERFKAALRLPLDHFGTSLPADVRSCVANLESVACVYEAQGADWAKGIECLLSRSESIDGELKGYLICDMAFYAAAGGDAAAAQRFLRQSEWHRASSDYGLEMERYYWLSHARVLVAMHRGYDALEIMPEVVDRGIERYKVQIASAEAFAEAGELSEARRHLAMAIATMNATTGLVSHHRQGENLQRIGNLEARLNV